MVVGFGAPTFAQKPAELALDAKQTVINDLKLISPAGRKH